MDPSKGPGALARDLCHPADTGRVDFADLLCHIGWIRWEELHSPELPRGARGLLPGAVPVAR
jgi:hypothetical protein